MTRLVGHLAIIRDSNNSKSVVLGSDELLEAFKFAHPHIWHTPFIVECFQSSSLSGVSILGSVLLASAMYSTCVRKASEELDAVEPRKPYHVISWSKMLVIVHSVLSNADFCRAAFSLLRTSSYTMSGFLAVLTCFTAISFLCYRFQVPLILSFYFSKFSCWISIDHIGIPKRRIMPRIVSRIMPRMMSHFIYFWTYLERHNLWWPQCYSSNAQGPCKAP